MLLLFDIDGTLMLRASAEHREAIHAAILEVHGVTVSDERLDTAGRTDASIAAELLVRAGVPRADIDAGFPALHDAAVRHYDRLCPDDLSSFVAPGVAEMLAAVTADEQVVASLLTGNYEAIARRKLAAAGLGDWFLPGQGGFGSDHHDRDALPAIARARAGRRTGGSAYPADRTVVIGDTPRDIACARADGVAVIAITTGPFDADALAAADGVVGTAAEVPAAIRAVLGAQAGSVQ